ncbi:type III secretion system (T3SS) SseB-like protein [Knoellia remsis]|uniref:Type III secretion system (T3SS) SseB-like protein n=1 Tax=Knoellia remsis TaxID=407159 RepID=A0A2T0UY20_9MICO|nr:SseB family protein [Knoellia remsis]PRY62830.1 type III secretion system (T3SS) SseB-like protein [Knoellia remsis]
MESESASAGRIPTVAELAIARGQQGKLSPATTLWTLAASELWIASDDEPQGNQLPTSPLIVAAEGRDVQLLAVFTDPGVMAPMLGQRVAVRVPGLELMRRMPPGAGMVINPGHPVGMELPAETISQFVADVTSPLA